MITSISQRLMSPIAGEDPASHQARVDEVRRVCRAALATGEGHALINLLLTAVNPMHSRFPGAATPEEAAFRDGQCDLLGFLVLEGTNLGLSRPS
jgi:hypothetical protein